jgi:hypothetical protein
MPVKLEHRIGIKAPAEVIWESLFDVPGWEAWNPLYPKAQGVVRLGAQLDLVLALPGQAPQPIKPVIIDWTPMEHIHWTTRTKGGLVKTIRFLEIDALTETGCIFNNGEVFDGMLGTRMAARQGRSIRAGFAALGEALQQRAEAAWRERQGLTT